MRLQVFLSHNGVSSRRKAMDIIKEGRVKVNGKINKEPSTPVDPKKDAVYVDGRKIQQKVYEYILLNKRAGYVTTKAAFADQKTVFDLIPKKFAHLTPVGRLDKDTEGLLLLTNDGDVAYALTHPKFDVDKIYFVRIEGRLEAQTQKKVERGIIIEGKKTAAAKITSVKSVNNSTELKITIHEGRKRQIRLMFAEVGHKVLYLKRLKQASLSLGQLEPGRYRMLKDHEIKALKRIKK